MQDNNLSYINILDKISNISEYLEIQGAYVENGQVVIFGALNPCAGGNYTFEITDSTYFPRLPSVGQCYFSTSDDVGSVNTIYLLSNARVAYGLIK